MSLKTFLKDRVKNIGINFDDPHLDVGYAETDTLRASPQRIAVLTVMDDSTGPNPPKALMAVGLYDAEGTPRFVGVLQFHDTREIGAGDVLSRVYALLFEIDDDYFEPTVLLKTAPTEEISTAALESLVYEKLNTVYAAANPGEPPLSPEQHADSDIMDVFSGAELREALTALSTWLRSREVGWAPGELMEIVFEHDTLGNFVADLALQVADEA